MAVFLVAVPYGKFADRHGKKKVIAASLIGLILARSWTILVRKKMKGPFQSDLFILTTSSFVPYRLLRQDGMDCTDLLADRGWKLHASCLTIPDGI